MLDSEDSITEYFESGISGWTPIANTNNEGKILIEIKGSKEIDKNHHLFKAMQESRANRKKSAVDHESFLVC